MTGWREQIPVITAVLMLLWVAENTQGSQDDAQRKSGVSLGELSRDGLQAMRLHQSRHKRGLIYPGTKWCGAGDIASSEDDLGIYVDLDICCRQHDHCNDSIIANQTRHGIQNDLLYTSSHCDCDELFRECLHKVESFNSELVGSIYFEIAICFSFEYPARCTHTRETKLGDKCVHYEYDKLAPHDWQFFDTLPWDYNTNLSWYTPISESTTHQVFTEPAHSASGRVSVALLIVGVVGTIIGRYVCMWFVCGSRLSERTGLL